MDHRRGALEMKGSFRICCDSMVALGERTADGNVHFAKNSDRPAFEPQPLAQQPRRQHAPGATLRCTYIEIPQAPQTAGLIGSRPHWCWGFEHGLNEYGVTIGNHTIFTKEQPSGLGLIGMDLVRLGLERSLDAAQAVDVITSLLETHGQGGSGFHEKDWAYNNSFLIADRRTAFVLETSDRHWVCREVQGGAALSNHVTTTDDAERLSSDVIANARDNGWWPADTAKGAAEDAAEDDGPFDFAAAYRDTSLVPAAISSGRHARACSLIDARTNAVDVAYLRRALRDHFG